MLYIDQYSNIVNNKFDVSDGRPVLTIFDWNGASPARMPDAHFQEVICGFCLTMFSKFHGCRNWHLSSTT